MVSCQATGFGEPTVVVEKVKARCQYAEAELPSDRLLKGELVEGDKPAILASCQKLRVLERGEILSLESPESN